MKVGILKEERGSYLFFDFIMNSVPAAAVRRRMQALSGMIGRKASVGGLLSLLLKHRAQPCIGGRNW